MKKKQSCVLIALLGIFVVFALIEMGRKESHSQPNSANTTTEPAEHSPVDAVSEATKLFYEKKYVIREIAIEAAFTFWQSKDAVFVDARPAGVYAEAHISGALSMPVYPIGDFFEKFTQQVARNRRIIVYCSSKECEASGIVASYLIDKGYSGVYHMGDGFIVWENEGHPVEP